MCVEDRIDADLALGRHADLVGELESLVSWNPLRERLRAQLMVALYRSGRQADALAVYHAYRDTLGERARAGAVGAHARARAAGSCARTSTSTGARRPRPRSQLKMEPIRYVQSVGGYSIAYQVIGDGPLDIVFVHGFICSFQPGWEWPALASFYRRLAGMGRLILFDKRGTGLSDRVLGIASLEERMDDVRAVMDAVGAERAAVVGVSEGGPMCTLFAATHPDRCQALITLGAYARRNWAPDYPIGRRAEQDGWLRPTAEQWGRFATERFLAERAPSIATDEEAIQWYTSYLVRGASPAAVAAITDMNEEIDVRHALSSVRVPTLVVYRAQEYLREASRYMGARLPGAQVVEVPGADHLPWEGDQGAVLDAIEHFLGGLRDERRRAEPHPHDGARGEPPGVRARGRPLGAGAVPRPAARRAARPRCGRASTVRPAPSAARPRWRDVRAAARGRAHRRVRAARRPADRPRARDRRRRRTRRAARRDPRDLDRGRSRRRLAGSSSPSAARSSCPWREPPASGACSASSADRYRAFTGGEPRAEPAGGLLYRRWHR